MTIKTNILGLSASLTGFVGNARAADNISLVPNANKGMQNLASLPYIDKLQWILDTVYALVPYVAVLALGFLALKFYTGGWDSVENELRTRKLFFSIITIVLLLKVGAAIIGLISAW